MAGRKKRHGMTEVLLISLTVLVLLAVFVVILAVVYPNASRSIISDTSDAFEENAGFRFGRSIGRRGGEGWDARIMPVVRDVSERLAGLFSGRRTTTTVKKSKKKTGPAFTSGDCTGCHEHENLFDETAFSSIYMDHRRHEAAEVGCPECHLTVKHPGPKLIQETACRRCHKREKVSDSCPTCHSPGSILDDAVVSKEKIDEFRAGGTAHLVSLVPPRFGNPDPKWLKGEGDPPCQSCHQVPAFCNTCHLAFHNKVSDWVWVHGPRILKMTYNMGACWACHNPNWCAGNCHIQEGATRSRAYLDVPNLTLTDD